MINRLSYWHRILKAYLLPTTSQLSFWHGTPKINSNFRKGKLGQYYMPFHSKAEYCGHHDNQGIPMLDYQGHIGLQYNPIAIAQWGLGNYNLWSDTKKECYYSKFIQSANWLITNLAYNSFDQLVWMHHFNFEYRDTLKSPWYSGLAQGQGLSLLIRAYIEEKDDKYISAAQDVFKSFLCTTNEGGVTFIDSNGNKWIEEYIVNPPTHILNGFIWALWGIYDYAIFSNDKAAKDLFESYNKTLINNLASYDTGYWSLYEHSNTALKMVASLFYHQLHVVQLQVMYILTNNSIFHKYAEKWSFYRQNLLYRNKALINKIIFKVFYY